LTLHANGANEIKGAIISKKKKKLEALSQVSQLSQGKREFSRQIILLYYGQKLKVDFEGFFYFKLFCVQNTFFRAIEIKCKGKRDEAYLFI
jgi:hypothetical protein